jgi:excinuclease ABC subunit C
MSKRPQERLDQLPQRPGVYLFRDRQDRVIYVGKARNLKNRVRSYFQPGRSDERFFINLLEHQLGDIETVVTASEKEALLLENNLIKEHQPRYNVRLRDDKDFLHLRIDLSAPWPKLELVRRPPPSTGSVKIFGPYHSARSARRTMHLASRHFRLRTCKDSALRQRTRPCLLYQMERCPAPCVYDVDRQAYLEQVHHALLFLAGKHSELVRELESKMRHAAGELAFERAAVYRDQLRAVEATLTDQHVVQLAHVDQDVFALHRQEGLMQVVVLQIREGKVRGKREFHWRDKEFHVPDGEVLSSLLGQYYEPGITIPPVILMPFAVEESEALAELLSERKGRKVVLHSPQRGHRAALVRLAQTNAQQLLKQRLLSGDDSEAHLAHIAQRLALATPPDRIECLDVAHHGPGRAVAAIAVAEAGQLAPRRTKSFTIKMARAGDDYGGMYEVLSRRFRRAKAEEPGWELPDVLVVDGGRGQLAVAQAALHDVGFPADALALVGLAKERAPRRGLDETPLKEASVERLYLPGRVNALTIRGRSPLLLFCRLRDEAHRLAGKLLQRHRQRQTVASSLDAVPGVGPALRRTLLRELGSARGVAQATLEELGQVPGVGPKRAREIHAHFHGNQDQAGSPAENAGKTTGRAAATESHDE